MTTNKPACSFCPAWGHTWATPEGGRICFNCLRGQRDEYHDQCRRQAEEIAALAETVSILKGQLHNPTLCDGNAAGKLIMLRGDLKSLHETTGRLLACLPAGNDHEEN